MITMRRSEGTRELAKIFANRFIAHSSVVKFLGGFIDDPIPNKNTKKNMITTIFWLIIYQPYEPGNFAVPQFGGSCWLCLHHHWLQPLLIQLQYFLFSSLNQVLMLPNLWNLLLLWFLSTFLSIFSGKRSASYPSRIAVPPTRFGLSDIVLIKSSSSLSSILIILFVFYIILYLFIIN